MLQMSEMRSKLSVIVAVFINSLYICNIRLSS